MKKIPKAYDPQARRERHLKNKEHNNAVSRLYRQNNPHMIKKHADLTQEQKEKLYLQVKKFRQEHNDAAIEVSKQDGKYRARWSFNEEELLIELIANNKQEDCAFILGRSMRAVENRLAILRKSNRC